MLSPNKRDFLEHLLHRGCTISGRLKGFWLARLPLQMHRHGSVWRVIDSAWMEIWCSLKKLKVSSCKYPRTCGQGLRVQQVSHGGTMSRGARLIEPYCAAQPAREVHLLHFRHLDEGVNLEEGGETRRVANKWSRAQTAGTNTHHQLLQVGSFCGILD